MTDRLRVGIVGCGGIANGKHMPSMKKADKFDIVAFCDILEARATQAAKDYGTPDAKVYTDYKALLQDKTIDAIYVLTPNKSHSFISIDAMEAGKNVMCEKPMAKTAAEAKAMVETAQRTGKLLTIGYNSRYTTRSAYVKEVVQRGDLGDIYFARAQALRRRGVPTWGVFLNEEEQGGGPLIDIGTHILDLTLWLMDNYKPKTVVGNVYHKLSGNGNCGNIFGPWDPKEFTVEDSAFGFITMENGATISLDASWALNIAESIDGQAILCGTKAGTDMYGGGVRVNGDDLGKLYEKVPNLQGGGVAFFDGDATDPNVTEQLVFYNAVTKGTPLVVLPEQAYVVTQLLEAIYESSKTGTMVTF